ncbi:MAG: hypothetical protein WDN28_13170 [Chthoniobacter sp.]
MLGFQGGIIGGNKNILKTGSAQNIVFQTTNSYTGTTTISDGAIFVGADVLPGVAGPLGTSTTAILLNSGGTNQAGVLVLPGRLPKAGTSPSRAAAAAAMRRRT